MPKITLDDLEFNTEDLSENGKRQVASLQFLESQLRKIHKELSVYQTARSVHIAVLKSEISEKGIVAISSPHKTDQTE